MPDSGFAALKMMRLSKQQAEGFYEVHRERPFYGGLVTFMTEGPVVVMVLERENAIKHWRELMGATNPANADGGNDPEEVCGEYRAQRGAWVGRAGDGGGGDPVLFQHVGTSVIPR